MVGPVAHRQARRRRRPCNDAEASSPASSASASWSPDSSCRPRSRPASRLAVTPTPDCVGHWPAAFQGRPTLLHAGARAGDYIWHDANGWHLRVTHKSHSKVTFTGKIVSSAPLTVTPARLEKADTWSLSADKKTLTYKFYNYGHVDGLDFKTDCAARSPSGARCPGRSCRPAGSGSARTTGIHYPTASWWSASADLPPQTVSTPRRQVPKPAAVLLSDASSSSAVVGGRGLGV